MYYVIHEDVQVATGHSIKLVDGALLVYDGVDTITSGYAPGGWTSFYLDED